MIWDNRRKELLWEMRVLVACEFSQRVTRAFRARGHEAYSCDLLPTEGNPDWHFQCDVRLLLVAGWWDLLIAHPDCTYLALSGLHWNYRVVGRKEKTEAALDFVRLLLAAPVPRIALENPVGCISTHVRVNRTRRYSRTNLVILRAS